MRRDLRAVLDAFVASHRGLRSGHVFGAPAAFAGRRMFAKLDRDGLRLRLPIASRIALRDGPAVVPSRDRRAVGEANPRPPSAHRAAAPSRPSAASRDWVVITPSSRSAQRLEMLLEQAARAAAMA